MATLPVDPALAQAAGNDAEVRSAQRLLEKLRKGASPDTDKKLRQACQGFESIFMNKLWAQMRKTVPQEGYLHSKEEEAYLSMFDQELMKKMSEAGGIGLGKMLYENLSDHLAKASAGTAARIAGRQEIAPLHPEEKGLPLHPGSGETSLRPGDRRDAGAQEGMPLSATDAARLAAEKAAAQAPAAPAEDAAAGAPVLLPPGFRGPDPTPPQGPEDLAVLNQALDLARRVESGRSAHRAAQAYRDAARDESAASPGQAPASLVTPLSAEPENEEPGV